MATWTGDPASLFQHPTALYYALIGTTVAHAGKAEEGPEGTVHRGGPSLRRLLQRMASVITAQGTEAVSFAELAARLEGDIALDKWTAQATTDNPLHELVVNFYFKGHPELGCEFLHKSFREYLHAESIVATLEALSEGRTGPLPPLGLDYWQDFPEGTSQRAATRALAALLAPQWLTTEVRAHLSWLLERAIQADRGRWTWIRDLLADVWAWWFEGVHLRAQPERRRARTEWNDPYAVDMLLDVVPREERSGAVSPRITALDGHLGEALIQLTAIVHAEVWSGDTAGVRPYQATIDDTVRFRPGNGFARQIAARIEAPGHRPAGPPFAGSALPAIVLDHELLTFCILDLCDLNRAHLVGAGLLGTNLTRADLSDADLSDARLGGANLTNADLTNTGLRHADLTSARLDEANLADADLSAANLTSARLGGTNLCGARLRGTVLTSAHLTATNLVGADLSAAHLVGANLNGAILIDAVLRGARFAGADLRDANLEGADLREASLDGARLPEGFDYSDLSCVRRVEE